jgi:photosystem II stability/assembly factor-like uncharacterized protein
MPKNSIIGRFFSLTIIFLFLVHPTSAQNSLDLFKVWPSDYAIETAPEWAQLMYQPEPEVKRVVDAYDEFYEKNRFEKTIHTQNYKYWIRKVEKYLNEEGFIDMPGPAEEKARFEFLKNKKAGNNRKSNNVWTSIGPFQTYKNGTTTPNSNHANIYALDQSQNNPNLLICGTESGGVFKSIDKALNWELISKQEVFCNGITAVAIDPDDDDIFYISGNNRIYKTLDGGSNWTENFYLGASAYEIKFDPSDADHIYLVTANGLFESMDDGNNWTQVFSEACWDLDYHPTNSDIIYLLKSNPGAKKTEFYKSINNGNSWTLISNGWYTPQVFSEASENGGKIAVSPDQPSRVYACLIGNSKNGDNGWIGLYRSDDAGNSWYLPSGQIGGPYAAINTMPWNAASYSSGYHQGFYNFDFEASPDDADLMWFGTIRLNESTDGGYNYVSIGAANSIRLADIHADIQSIHIQGSDIWIASDGGMNYSDDNLITHEALNYGIIASDFWGFGAGWNEDVLVGGKYHNGNTAYHENYGLGYSHNVGGVEEATGYVNPLINKNVYFNQYWSGYTVSKLIPQYLGGSTQNLSPINLIPNESYLTSYSSGFYHHPLYANEMIAGKDSIIWQSHDGGTSWQALHNFGTGRVLEIEYSRSNPEVIYCVFQPGENYWNWCEIYKTTDGGSNWSSISNIPSNNRWRLQISVNPLDENEIWVATVNGGNGHKIYKSTDGGSNWVNMTTAAFDNDKIKDIAYHAGIDERVYALTDASFYYYNKNSQSWVQYDSGLPVIQNVLSLKLFYRDSKIRMCSSGRGFWEADMPETSDPLAMPMVLNDTLFCSRDTIRLESHSVIDHFNASWNWTISPTPQYVSSYNIRNPEVVFGSEGYYDIGLTVTDNNGNSASINVPQMVFVNSYCDADTIPGLAIKTSNQGDWVQLPDLSLNTNSFAMTAWVKTDGLQNNYASVIMSDDDAVGLNFRESNNTLGYHWFNGGAWWWDSNLIVPQDIWTHVAMSVDPTGVSLFVNGVEARHNTNISPVEIKTMKIGSYKGWQNRNFFGEIDELTIWNKALTANEIRLNRHLTYDQLTSDPDLVAYYQFNSATSIIYDKANSNNGTRQGATGFTYSPIPVGGGTSEILTINNNGSYSFGNTGATMNFSGSGSLPDGQLVVSRINHLPFPDLYNSENLGAYFIINNYGDISFTSNYDISFDDPFSSPSTIAHNDPNSVRLLNRPSNSVIDDWQVLCLMTSVSNEDYSFNNNSNCYMPSMGQYFINHCIPVIYETQDYIDGDILSIRAGQLINANNTIQQGADIKYSTQGVIELDLEFEVQPGAIFETLLSGCQH